MANFTDKLNAFAVELHKIGVLKFGDFKMKVGINSPVYCDLRLIISHPKLLDTLTDLLCEYSKDLVYNQLCGVPYTALPIATLMSVKLSTPMLIRRKEQKSYGTKQLIEGKVNRGERCLIVEDVVTSGSSILETVNDLTKAGLEVQESIVVLDREQGGVENLNEMGITMHSLFTMTSLMNALLAGGCIDQATVDSVKKYVQSAQIRTTGEMKNGSVKPKSRLQYSFQDRAKQTKNTFAKRLFDVMVTKESTLCFAADVTDSSELLRIAEAVGPFIAMLKTHVDILQDFTPAFIPQLQAMAKKHNFLLLEDRKFADIGNVVKQQYSSGIYRISSWADAITVHAIPGPGIIEGIRSVSGDGDKGIFWLAEMSSAENLITNAYSNEAMRLADNNRDLIAGIVCQSKDLITFPGLIQLTPGVKLNSSNDALGQVYNSPEAVVLEKGADVAVVGRGILESKNPAKAAQEYQTALWAAYQRRLTDV